MLMKKIKNSLFKFRCSILLCQENSVMFDMVEYGHFRWSVVPIDSLLCFVKMNQVSFALYFSFSSASLLINGDMNLVNLILNTICIHIIGGVNFTEPHFLWQ